MSKTTLLAAAFAVIMGTGIFLTASEQSETDQRTTAKKLYKEGNYKESLAVYKKLLLSKETDPQKVGEALTGVVNCMNNLGQTDQIDEVREKAITLHAKNWRFLQTAAQSYYNTQHYGYLVAGKYYRGGRRQPRGAKYVSSQDRDRVRGLQLYEQARLILNNTKAEEYEKSQFLYSYASAVRWNFGYWKLQKLTDVSKLPDYSDTNRWRRGRGWGGGGSAVGVPVDAEGNPVFYHTPASFEKSKSDGERWRWLIEEVGNVNPNRKNEMRRIHAGFLSQNFGVQTVSHSIFPYGRPEPVEENEKGDAKETKTKPGAFSVKTLKEDETICRLATGIKRITLPDEFNSIRIYQTIIASGKSSDGEVAYQQLSSIFKNRMQFPKAVKMLELSIENYGDRHSSKKTQIDQIAGNWGVFEGVKPQPSEQGAKIPFRFRNATHVDFIAHEIDTEKLLADLKTYLKSNPKRLDWQKLNISSIGHRLIRNDETKYIGKQAASWGLDLKPAKDHFDRRVTVTTPLQKAGAYLVEANVKNGNKTRIIVWVDDTVILKKNLGKHAWYFIADAKTGAPIPKANVEFFGYRQEYHNNRKRNERRHTVHFSNFAEFSDANGQVMPDPSQMQKNYQWMAVARTKEGRLAYLGFTGIWYNNYYDHKYDQTKTYVITDRPVYRPGQKVKFKFWIRQARFDKHDLSPHAGKTISIEAKNPRSESVYKKTFTADKFGGFDGEFELPKNATLGNYNIHIDNSKHNHRVYGGLQFRVEEYKKPEYEVTIEAPEKPVALGEKK